MVLGTHTYPFLLVSWISKIPPRHNIYIYIKRVLIDSRMSHSPLCCLGGGPYPAAGSRRQNSQDGVFLKEKKAKQTHLLGGPLSSIPDFSDRPLHAGARWLGRASIKGLRGIFMVNYSFTAQHPAVRRVIFGNVWVLSPPTPLPAERVFTTTPWQTYPGVPIHLMRGVS